MQKGILQSSELFFYSGAFNPRLFFYPLSAGHFYCTSGYRVDRSSFDSILIAYIVRGTFSFLYQGRELTAKAGEIALVDCFGSHVLHPQSSGNILAPYLRQQYKRAF